MEKNWISIFWIPYFLILPFESWRLRKKQSVFFCCVQIENVFGLLLELCGVWENANWNYADTTATNGVAFRQMSIRFLWDLGSLLTNRVSHWRKTPDTLTFDKWFSGQREWRIATMCCCVFFCFFFFFFFFFFWTGHTHWYEANLLMSIQCVQFATPPKNYPHSLAVLSGPCSAPQLIVFTAGYAFLQAVSLMYHNRSNFRVFLQWGHWLEPRPLTALAQHVWQCAGILTHIHCHRHLCHLRET